MQASELVSIVDSCVAPQILDINPVLALVSQHPSFRRLGATVKYEIRIPIWADVRTRPKVPVEQGSTGTVKYQDLLCTEAEKGTAAIKGYGSDRMMS